MDWFNPIFNGKIYGFRLRFSRRNQSIWLGQNGRSSSEFLWRWDNKHFGLHKKGLSQRQTLSFPLQLFWNPNLKIGQISGSTLFHQVLSHRTWKTVVGYFTKTFSWDFPSNPKPGIPSTESTQPFTPYFSTGIFINIMNSSFRPTCGWKWGKSSGLSHFPNDGQNLGYPSGQTQIIWVG